MKIWINRYDTDISASKIRALGLTPVVAPIIELCRYTIPQYDDIKTVVTTSSNAIPNEGFYNCDFITVGSKSADILRSTGRKVVKVFDTVNDLVLSLKNLDHSNTLYLRGEHISVDLKKEIGCSEFIAYSMKQKILSQTELSNVKDADCVLIYSKRSGEVLIKVILRYGIDPKNMDAVCISENVALGVKGVGFRNIIISSEATEDKIIEQLQKNYKGSPK
jgi:uroporphyrinogen-III synthase